MSMQTQWWHLQQWYYQWQWCYRWQWCCLWWSLLQKTKQQKWVEEQNFDAAEQLKSTAELETAEELASVAEVDIIIICQGTKNTARQLCEQLNQPHPKMKISWNISDSHNNFLDVNVHVTPHIYVSIYQKPYTNISMYLSSPIILQLPRKRSLKLNLYAMFAITHSKRISWPSHKSSLQDENDDTYQDFLNISSIKSTIMIEITIYWIELYTTRSSLRTQTYPLS